MVIFFLSFGPCVKVILNLSLISLVPNYNFSKGPKMSYISGTVRRLCLAHPCKEIWKCSFQLKSKFSMYVSKQDHNKCLKVVDGHKSTSYHYFWLRDHCRCYECYNSVTAQRRLNISQISIDIKPKVAHVENGILRVIWEGGHKSEYDISWLEDCLYENFLKRIQRNYILWSKNSACLASIAHVDYHKLLESDDCLRNLIESLINYGVGFAENVPVSVEGTEEVARRIGQIQNTLFGGMWEFSDTMDHYDTAYTREGLEAHTDNTYFTEAAGLQILHCLVHDGSGGETILVDGFKASSILKEKHPDIFDRLTSTSVASEYIEGGQHHIFRAPIIRLCPVTKNLEQIRFNMNDRAPLILPHNQIPRYYEDLCTFNTILKDPELEWKFKINPGTVLIMDNFRVLHGRASYTGKRTMCGCYIGRSDYLSKARVLKLLEK